MFNPAFLSGTFWIETALLGVSAIVLWLVVVAIKRGQQRRNFQIWQGSHIVQRSAPPVRRHADWRSAP